MNAAVLYSSAGRSEEAAARVAALRPLLDSPYLPAELRESAQQRLHI